jgi:hypothetical protein
MKERGPERPGGEGVKTYSQDEIDDLISCPKVIIEPPKKEMRSERGTRRNNMELRSAEGDLEFSVFMRINEDFPENFSVGLNYSPRDERGTLCLFRCNGPHDHLVGTVSTFKAHFGFHVHRAKAENIEAGLRPECGGELSEGYASYRDALAFFLRRINVINALEHFPEFSQLTLPLDLEENQPYSIRGGRKFRARKRPSDSADKDPES